MQVSQPKPACPEGAVDTVAPPTGRAVRTLSTAAMTLFSFTGAMLIAARSSAVTPLYPLFHASMHLPPYSITCVFEVSGGSLLTRLVTVASLSAYFGSKPVMLAAL